MDAQRAPAAPVVTLNVSPAMRPQFDNKAVFRRPMVARFCQIGLVNCSRRRAGRVRVDMSLRCCKSINGRSETTGRDSIFGFTANQPHPAPAIS
jgi:hypothetical protein